MSDLRTDVDLFSRSLGAATRQLTYEHLNSGLAGSAAQQRVRGVGVIQMTQDD